jgi:hypothetical protein
MRKLAHSIYHVLIPHFGLVLALVVFSLQLFLLPSAGMSWDEPASFFIGRANLKYWLSGNRAYIDDIKNKALFTDSPIQYVYGEDIYPPFPFLVSSTMSYIFAEQFHLMNVLTAHHLGELILGVCGVWALYGLAIEAGLPFFLSSGVALAYAFYPVIFEYMRADPKDLPLVSMLTMAMYFMLRTINAWRKKNTVRIWVSGICFAFSFGLAQCTKPTAAILVPIALVWLVAAFFRSKTFRKTMRPLCPFGVFTGALILLAVLVFFLFWPWLWADPVGRLLTVWSFFKTVGYNMPTPFFGTIYHAGINVPWEYPFVILVIQSPIELTFLAGIGMVWAVYQYIRNKTMIPVLFVLWFWIGLGRFLIPGMIIYSRVRHFIDMIPSFFVLSGFGAYAIYLWISSRIHRTRIIWMVIFTGTFGVIIFHQLFIIKTLYPYESQYFNVLVGGVKRVAENKLFDVGSTTEIKEAVKIINTDTKGDPALIYPCLMGHIARFYTAPNVKITSITENAQYMIVPNSVSWFEGAMTFGKTHQTPIYTIKRDGAELFYVFKYTGHFGWRCGWETKSNYEE